MYMKQLVYAPYWTKQVASVIVGTLMSHADGYVGKTTWLNLLSPEVCPWVICLHSRTSAYSPSTCSPHWRTPESLGEGSGCSPVTLCYIVTRITQTSPQWSWATNRESKGAWTTIHSDSSPHCQLKSYLLPSSGSLSDQQATYFLGTLQSVPD